MSIGKNKRSHSQGFTLVELLIVIAIIAILAGVAFAALNPLVRFQDARDASRWHDVTETLNAAVLNQVDNGGTLLASIAAMNHGEVYMIGTAGSGCAPSNLACDTDVTSTAHCVDLAGLVSTGYLPAVPISPTGVATTTWSAAYTGYTLERSVTSTLTLRSCESENTTEIFLKR